METEQRVQELVAQRMALQVGGGVRRVILLLLATSACRCRRIVDSPTFVGDKEDGSCSSERLPSKTLPHTGGIGGG